MLLVLPYPLKKQRGLDLWKANRVWRGLQALGCAAFWLFTPYLDGAYGLRSEHWDGLG